MHQDPIENLRQQIHDAALDPRRWQDFMNSLAREAGDICTHMFGMDVRSGRTELAVTSGFSPEFLQSYDAYFGERNCWAPGFARLLPMSPVPAEQLAPRESLLATEF